MELKASSKESKWLPLIYFLFLSYSKCAQKYRNIDNTCFGNVLHVCFRYRITTFFHSTVRLFSLVLIKPCYEPLSPSLRLHLFRCIYARAINLIDQAALLLFRNAKVGFKGGSGYNMDRETVSLDDDASVAQLEVYLVCVYTSRKHTHTVYLL